MPSEKPIAFRNLGPKLLAALLALFGLVTLFGCQGSPSILNPQSPGAADISNLAWTLFFIALPVFVVVEGLLVFAALRFRSRGEGEEPRQIEGHTPIEVLWTAAPGVVLIIILFLTFQSMAVVLETPPDSMRIEVVGHQFWWEARYPDDNFVTANEIHVPVGRSVRVDLSSVDVIHSFWVPELGGKVDMVPGHRNQTTFRAVKIGTYRGQCAEFCGLDHAYMGFLTMADSPREYEAWVRNQQQPAARPTTPEAMQGEAAFLTAGCAGCHAIVGTNARGVLGPNLTHIGSRQTIGANLLANNPENMARWLADPQALKPGNLMPNLRLDSTTIGQLVAYLESLK